MLQTDAVILVQSDYAICIDQEWTLDACDRVKDLSSFSPCHINHSSTRNNVIRKPLRSEHAIHFFAKRHIQVCHMLSFVNGAPDDGLSLS